jgi:hypothetical protein
MNQNNIYVDYFNDSWNALSSKNSSSDDSSTDSSTDSSSIDSSSTDTTEKYDNSSDIWTEKNLVNYRQIISLIAKNTLQDTLRICLSFPIDKKTNWPLKPIEVPIGLDIKDQVAFTYHSLFVDENRMLDRDEAGNIIVDSDDNDGAILDLKENDHVYTVCNQLDRLIQYLHSEYLESNSLEPINSDQILNACLKLGWSKTIVSITRKRARILSWQFLP